MSDETDRVRTCMVCSGRGMCFVSPTVVVWCESCQGSGKKEGVNADDWQSFLAQIHPDANGLSFECAPGSLRNEFMEWRAK